MAKAILEFDLNDPDDVEFHKKVISVKQAYSVLWEYDQWLRKIIKYEEREKWASIDEAREKLYELLNEHGIDFD